MKKSLLELYKQKDYLDVQVGMFNEFASAFSTRMETVQIDIFEVCEKAGHFAKLLTSAQDLADKTPFSNLLQTHAIEKIKENGMRFFVELAVIVRFLYPMMEQLDASIKKYVEYDDLKENL